MTPNRTAQLIELKDALAAVAKKATAIDAEMIAYLAEMALIQVNKDLNT